MLHIVIRAIAQKLMQDAAAQKAAEEAARHTVAEAARRVARDPKVQRALQEGFRTKLHRPQAPWL